MPEKHKKKKRRTVVPRTVQFHEPAESAMFTDGMLRVPCKDKHERDHQEFFRPFSLWGCVMQLLYCLGSLCHLTAV